MLEKRACFWKLEKHFPLLALYIYKRVKILVPLRLQRAELHRNRHFVRSCNFLSSPYFSSVLYHLSPSATFLRRFPFSTRKTIAPTATTAATATATTSPGPATAPDRGSANQQGVASSESFLHPPLPLSSSPASLPALLSIAQCHSARYVWPCALSHTLSYGEGAPMDRPTDRSVAVAHTNRHHHPSPNLPISGEGY